jgi:hypothetical protein
LLVLQWNAAMKKVPPLRLAALIGAFVGQLDASIVQIALPPLAHAFDVPVSDVR